VWSVSRLTEVNHGESLLLVGHDRKSNVNIDAHRRCTIIDITFGMNRIMGFKTPISMRRCGLNLP
jgi:hypothetical protein